MRMRTVLIWIAGAVAAFVLLIAVAVVSAPLWFDAEGVKTRVADLLSKATAGEIRFESMDLHFLPLPGATVTDPSFSLPQRFELEAQSASVDLDLLALLRARFRIGSVDLIAPKITIAIPEPTQDAQPMSIDVVERAIRDASARIAERAPDMQFAVEDGSVLLLVAGRQPLTFDNLQLQAEATPDRIEATVSCTSNLWDHLTMKMNLAASDLTGNGTLEMIGLRTHQLGQALGRGETWPVQQATTDATVQWQMKGLADVQAEGSLSAANVSLRFGERHVDLHRPTIDVSALFRKGATEIAVRRLVLDHPRLDATAKLSHSDTGAFALEATATNVDLSALQATAASLAPGDIALARLPLNITQGIVTSLQMNSESDTLSGLVRPEALQAQLEFAALDALVPDYDIGIREAAGTVSLNAGELELRNAKARVGKSTLSDGHVWVSLGNLLTASASGQQPGKSPAAREPKPAAKSTKPIATKRKQIESAARPPALRVDAKLDIDLPEGLATARRVIRDGQVKRQLDQIKQLSGRAKFRMRMTMDSKQSDVRIDVSGLQATARHAKVPFAIPIRLTRGQMNYVDDAFLAQDLDGAIGTSTFAGIGARIGAKAPNELSASKGSAQLALGELLRWAAAFPESSKHVDKIEKAAGTLAVSITKLEGPLRSPKKLRFQLNASPQQVSIDAPTLGPRSQFNGGEIDISQTRIRMHDVTLSSLDASVRIGGAISDYRDGLTNFQARVNGSTGVESLEWLRVRAGLPETVQFRNPLQISRLDANWRRDGELAARGKLEVSDGPAVGFAMRMLPDYFEVEHISLRDQFSEVDAGGKLEGTRFDVRFKGKLVEQSITRIFKKTPYEFRAVTGDMRVTGDWNYPDRTAAGGNLQGSMIAIPATRFLRIPVTVETFSIEGQDQKLLIKKAKVTSGDSRLDVSGSIAASGDQFVLDADVTGDRIVIPLPTDTSRSDLKTAPKDDALGTAKSTVNEVTAAGAKQITHVENFLARVNSSGRIRIDIKKLVIGKRELTPFIAAASLKNQRLVVNLEQTRLCNVSLTGGFKAVVRGPASLNIEAHARNIPVERSIPCLTNGNIQLTGMMQGDANFVASGSRTEFLDSARATYALSVGNGEIRKFDALDKVIDKVNETRAAKGKLHDIDESSLRYKTMSVRGDIDLRMLRFDQALLDIDDAKIVAQGTVEIATEKIDATVLVAPLRTINKIVDKVPILGNIFGGSVLAVPVGVRGTIKKPVVVPLAPGAVATRLVDILTNTLKLPADLLNATVTESRKLSPPANTVTPSR